MSKQTAVLPSEALLPWVWAVEEQLRVLDNFDQKMIDETKAGRFAQYIPVFQKQYNLTQYASRDVLQNHPDVFAEVCTEFFSDPPNDLDAANTNWHDAVDAISKRTELSDRSILGGVWSATLKAYWFYQPDRLTMYDHLACEGLKIDKRGDRKKLPRGCGVDTGTFLANFESFYNINKMTINEAIAFVDRPYPYPMRVADKYLWLLGCSTNDASKDLWRLGTDKMNFILESFRSALKVARYSGDRSRK